VTIKLVERYMQCLYSQFDLRHWFCGKGKEGTALRLRLPVRKSESHVVAQQHSMAVSSINDADRRQIQ
jgi:hypothetical protein